MKHWKRFFLPSISVMLFLSIFLCLSLSGRGNLLNDGDTGYHIRAGEWILEHLSVPRVDMFSFLTPPLPWTAHEWLSEAIMALVHNVSGLTGVVVFFAFMIAATYYLLFLMIRSRGGNILMAVFVVLLASAASQIHWLARPHVFSLPLFIVWYGTLEDFRNGNRNRLYLLPLTMLLWVNLHGGYLAGFLLLGTYLTGTLPGCFSDKDTIKATARRHLRSLAVILGICIPVSCINPYGYHILMFPFKLVSNKFIMDNVGEFLSPNFHQSSPFKFLILLLVAVLALSRKRLRATEILLILLFLNMALYSSRYIPLFAIIAAPLLVRYGSYFLENARGRAWSFFKKKSGDLEAVEASSGGIPWLIAAVITVSYLSAMGRIHHEFDPKIQPVAAVRFLEKSNLPGNMFNNDEFGDYLIYAAWPRYKVFFDGRIDMYGSFRLREYARVINFEKGWEKILDRYRIKWIFFNSNSRFSRFLKEKKEWTLIYHDDVADIFIKNSAENRAIIEQYVSGHPLDPR